MPDISRGPQDEPPRGAPLRGEHRATPSGTTGDDLYDVSEPPAKLPASEGAQKPSGASEDAWAQPGGGSSGGSTGWYMAKRGGHPEGPMDLAELRRRALAGQLHPSDIVWREGMPDWIEARGVGELFGPATTAAGPPPTPPGRATPSPSPATIGPEIVWQHLNAVFARPVVYRVVGRISAALGALTLAVSIVLAFIGLKWFTGAVLFAILFLLGEAAAAILERLPAATPAAQPPAEKPASAGEAANAPLR